MNVLILGAAGGIGSSLVEKLDSLDTKLFLGYHNKKITSNHPSHQVNGSDFEATDTFVKSGLERLGSIDGVVCLAGNLILKPD